MWDHIPTAGPADQPATGCAKSGIDFTSRNKEKWSLEPLRVGICCRTVPHGERLPHIQLQDSSRLPAVVDGLGGSRLSNRAAGEDRVHTTSCHDPPHPPTKGVTSSGDRRVSTVLLDGAAPDPILMIEAGRAVEVSMHAAGDTYIGVRLFSRDAQLRTENGNFEILGALVTKVHLSVLRELDRAPD